MTILLKNCPCEIYLPLPLHHKTKIANSINAVNNLRQYATIAAVNGDATSTDSDEQSPNDQQIPSIRLSVEEKAKTVISVCTSGTLCTTSKEDGIEGSPFGSFVDYVLDDEGNPILLMNEMSMHTMNIAEKGEGAMVSLFAQLSGNKKMDGSSGNTGGTAQDVSRCSITGTIEKIDPEKAEDMDTIRMRYSITHAYADQP